MPVGIKHHKAAIHDLKAAADAWGYMSKGVKEAIKYHEDKIKELQRKKHFCKNGVCDLNMFDFCRCEK